MDEDQANIDESNRLVERLADLLWILVPYRNLGSALADHVRYPRGARGLTFRGSELGRAIWSTTQAAELLDLIKTDPEVQRVLPGPLAIEGEARLIIASAVQHWVNSAETPPAFAMRIAGDLWTSLRREHVSAFAFGIVEGVGVQPPGLAITPQDSILYPSEDRLSAAFGREWPSYLLKVPAGPFSLFFTHQTLSRDEGGGLFAVPYARASLEFLREALWLASGHLPKIGQIVSIEESPVPVSGPLLVDPEMHVPHLPAGVEIRPEQFLSDLQELVPRLAVLHREHPLFRTVDPNTIDELRALRNHVGSAMHASSSEISAFIAFAAIEGRLRSLDESESADREAKRFSYLCAASDDETSRLRQHANTLIFLRRAIAHGRSPTNRQMDAFLGRSADVVAGLPPGYADLPWRPGFWDSSDTEAHRAALLVLRRLYHTWLMATLSSDTQDSDQAMTPGETRELVAAAVRGNRQAQHQLHNLNRWLVREELPVPDVQQGSGPDEHPSHEPKNE